MTDQGREPPVIVNSQGLDVSPRRTGHAGIDMVVAACAIFMSLLSLAIAFNQTRMMRQQVAASSWPLVQYSSGNTDDQKHLVISLNVKNAGVGPAIIKQFTLRYGNRSYKNVFEFLADCCQYRVTHFDPGVIEPGSPLTSPIEGTIIRPGDDNTFLSMPLAPENRAAWTKLDHARSQLSFDACYCSVLGECWRSNLRDIEPESVDDCPINKARSRAG
jgi:hypothetical protein